MLCLWKWWKSWNLWPECPHTIQNAQVSAEVGGGSGGRGTAREGTPSTDATIFRKPEAGQPSSQRTQVGLWG